MFPREPLNRRVDSPKGRYAALNPAPFLSAAGQKRGDCRLRIFFIPGAQPAGAACAPRRLELVESMSQTTGGGCDEAGEWMPRLLMQLSPPSGASPPNCSYEAERRPADDHELHL